MILNGPLPGDGPLLVPVGSQLAKPAASSTNPMLSNVYTANDASLIQVYR